MRYHPAVRLLRLAWRLHNSTVGLTLEDIQYELGDDTKPASRSTAERSKRAIEQAFPQFECANPDEPGPKRWRIPSGELSGLISFGGDELAALEAAAQLCVRQGMEPQSSALRGVAEKLRASLTNGLAARASAEQEVLATAEGIAHRPGPRAKVDPEIIAVLRHAIKALRQVRLQYRGRESGMLSRQRVSPLGILYGSRNYLLAFNHNKGVRSIRSFALSNIQKVDVLEWPAHRPPEFVDLKSYTANWFGVFDETPVDVVLRFNRQAAEDARNFVFHPSQTIRELPRGRLEVGFHSGGLREIAHHLLAWGTTVRVVKPPELSHLLKHWPHA